MDKIINGPKKFREVVGAGKGITGKQLGAYPKIAAHLGRYDVIDTIPVEIAVLVGRHSSRALVVDEGKIALVEQNHGSRRIQFGRLVDFEHDIREAIGSKIVEGLHPQPRTPSAGIHLAGTPVDIVEDPTSGPEGIDGIVGIEVYGKLPFTGLHRG